MSECESEQMGTADLERALEVGVVTDEHLSLFVAVLDERVVDEVYFTIGTDDSYAVFSGED